MGRFNRITLANTKKLFGVYRYAKPLGKLAFWASFIILPSLLLWNSSGFESAQSLAIGLASISLGIHLFISYTEYIAVLIPNIIHLMIMPFPFGYYWIIHKNDPNAVFTGIMDIYTPGAVLGAITTVLIVLGVIKLTRGKMWLTFTLVYVCVDFVGMLWVEAQPSAGLLIPATLIAVVLFIRSKLLHRLIFKKKHITEVDNLFKLNETEKAQSATREILESEFQDDTVIPLGNGGFFEYIVITKNRIFLIYSLSLHRSLNLVRDLNKGTQVKLRDNSTHLEFGKLMQEAVKLSKKYSLPSADMTPVILCHNNALPRDKRFLAVKVGKKNAGIKNNETYMGLLYLIGGEKSHLLHDVWKKHTLSKKTLKFLKRNSSDDRKEEAAEELSERQ